MEKIIITILAMYINTMVFGQQKLLLLENETTIFYKNAEVSPFWDFVEYKQWYSPKLSFIYINKNNSFITYKLGYERYRGGIENNRNQNGSIGTGNIVTLNQTQHSFSLGIGLGKIFEIKKLSFLTSFDNKFAVTSPYKLIESYKFINANKITTNYNTTTTYNNASYQLQLGFKAGAFYSISKRIKIGASLGYYINTTIDIYDKKVDYIDYINTNLSNSYIRKKISGYTITDELQKSFGVVVKI